MKIVFVHGRAQEHKDPDALRREWLQAAIRGVADAGLRALPALSESGVVLPYYGNLLFKLTDEIGRDRAKALVDRGVEASVPPAPELEFNMEIVLQIAQSKGISMADIEEEVEREVGVAPGTGIVDRAIQNWRIVLAALRLLDRLPQVSEAVIERVTRDVWCYLTNKGLRLQIDRIVDDAIPVDEPCVVVAHSLGSIVAYNLLMNRKRTNVRALITIGSPLGIEAIWSRLPSDTPPRRAPAGVVSWSNLRDSQDTVALYEVPADRYRGDPGVVNESRISNGSDNHHGIVEYLHHGLVANRIHQAVVAAG